MIYEGDGRQVGVVHDVFIKRILALQAAGLGLHEGAADPATGRRPWMLGPLEDWDGSLDDVENMSQDFDRQAIADEYGDALTVKDDVDQNGNPISASGQCAGIRGLRLQHDFVAAEERAFRLRHCSRLRAAGHAAARRRAHASPFGVFGAGTMDYVQTILGGG